MSLLAPTPRPVGNACLDKHTNRWMVTLEPHAMTWAKRIFTKIDKAEIGTFYLADTPETALHLQWFSQLYPLEWEPPGYVEQRAQQFRAQATLIERIMSAWYAPPNFALEIPPRDYQARAAALVLESGALLLGDDMGLGKTITAFAMLSDPRALPCVYVTLTHLPLQVQRMLARFAPKLRSHVVKVGIPYDITHKPYTRSGAKLPMPDVIIISWSKLAGWAETLARVLNNRGSVIYDEAHELRHPGTARYAAAAYLARHATYKLEMSGTPVFGMGSQIYHVISAVKPDALGRWEEFVREWCEADGSDKPAVKDPDALGLYLRRTGLMLRRTRKEVGRELPPFQIVMQPVEYDERPLAEVMSFATDLASTVLRYGDGATKMKAAGELDWRMRLATGLAKARSAIEFVKLLLESGERVLVGLWHRQMYDLFMTGLAEWKPAMYSGSESPTQKEDSRRRFCDPAAKDGTRVLLMSNRSGAGLDDLQYSGCSVIVHCELDWSSAVHEQFDCRIYRDGQPSPVVAYYLITNSGSDPIIAEVLGLKSMQLEGIRNPGAPRVEKAPDQTAIRERMRRLAIDHLLRHDPMGLARIRLEAVQRLEAAIARGAPDGEIETLAATLDGLPSGTAMA